MPRRPRTPPSDLIKRIKRRRLGGKPKPKSPVKKRKKITVQDV